MKTKNKTIINSLLFQILFLAFFSFLLNGELFAHSLNAFLMPTLIAFYIVYMSFILFVKNKFKLDYKKLFVLGATIGLLLETFYTKSFFVNPLIFGFNPLSVLVQIIFWGGMATVLPLYLWNKLILKSESDKRMNIGVLIFLLLEFTIGVFQIFATPIWVIFGFIFGPFILKFVFKKK